MLLFRRRRVDRHGRTRGLTSCPRWVGAQQIGDPLECGEHALVLVSRRRLLRRANLERWVGSRRPRVDGGDWPRVEVDRGHRIRPNVAGARLDIGAGRRTDLHRLWLNVGRMWGHLHATSARRSGHWLRRPDICLARRRVGPMGWDIGRRRGVGEARSDQCVRRCRPIGIDVGECGPGEGFRRFLMRLLLGHARTRIGLCALARRHRFGVLHALKRRLRDSSVGIPLRRRALLNGWAPWREKEAKSVT